MIFLSTTDNKLGVSLKYLGCASENAAEVYKDLSNVANLSLKELCAKNPSLIVFPQILGETRDGIEELKIFEFAGSFENPLDAKITTGNLMGFIGIDGTQLKISSRFTKDDAQDFFLHYMLQKVFSINLFDYKYTTSSNGELDLLLFLFPHFLKKALAQGVYRQYQTFEKNDANVKGVIDVNRHTRQNIPFGGRVAYKSRERTFNNSVTQLIRHTIEAIKTTPFGNALLTRDSEVKKCIQEIVAATESYTVRNCEKVIAKNLKPISHPYFTAYKPLQKLCLAILSHRKNGYGNSKNKVYGILFDGAWLWEEYLATILTSCGFSHPKNKENCGGIRMFEKPDIESSFDKNNRKLYPDFYRKNDISSNGGYILDAKYKRLQNGVGREDLYQIVTYMHTMNIQHGGFVYPFPSSEIKTGIDRRTFLLSGLGGAVETLGFSIPQNATNFTEFLKQIHDAEIRFCETVAS